MKRNACSQCRREIGSLDFYMESKSGKICSDCLMEIEPVVAEDVHLFKRREQGEMRDRRSAGTISLHLKEAL